MATLEERVGILERHMLLTSTEALSTLANSANRAQADITVFRREVKEEFAAFRQEVTERFDAIDARFDAIDARFASVDTRFAEVDTRFAEVNTKIDANQAENNRRFDRIEEILGELLKASLN